MRRSVGRTQQTSRQAPRALKSSARSAALQNAETIAWQDGMPLDASRSAAVPVACTHQSTWELTSSSN
jgi:hypothetical protein